MTNQTATQNASTTGNASTRSKPGVRDTASQAYDRTRERARETAARAAEGIEANPLSVLVGGVALGALAGSVIPFFAREKELLAPVGKRLSETASATVQAAREAGKAEIESFIPTRDNARDHLVQAVGNVLTAAKSTPRS
jgi:ElaB/YqjD/DUF883 family membrane-anchored ribosome-binding protein